MLPVKGAELEVGIKYIYPTENCAAVCGRVCVNKFIGTDMESSPEYVISKSKTKKQ